MVTVECKCRSESNLPLLCCLDFKQFSGDRWLISCSLHNPGTQTQTQTRHLLGGWENRESGTSCVMETVAPTPLNSSDTADCLGKCLSSWIRVNSHLCRPRSEQGSLYVLCLSGSFAHSVYIYWCFLNSVLDHSSWSWTLALGFCSVFGTLCIPQTCFPVCPGQTDSWTDWQFSKYFTLLLLRVVIHILISSLYSLLNIVKESPIVPSTLA